MDTAERQVSKSEQEWREQLTPAQYEVLRKAGTEPPFTGEYVYNKQTGEYRCAGCGAALFGSDTKFESGTGWPSFTEPAVAEAVELRPDNSLFMRRTEVLCRRCGGPPRPRLRRRPGTHGAALLHQLAGAVLRARPAAMIMQEQSRRLSQPLRWGRREKTIVGTPGRVRGPAAWWPWGVLVRERVARRARTASR